VNKGLGIACSGCRMLVAMPYVTCSIQAGSKISHRLAKRNHGRSDHLPCPSPYWLLCRW
jgi:hypothetical protein